MAHLMIASSNPDLSWVLVKNPDTGLQMKSIRQGQGFGWFDGEHNEFYHMVFQDGVDVDSFGGADFEYLSVGKFGHPMAHSSLLTTFLRDVWQGKNSEGKDVVADNVIVLSQVTTKATKLLEHLQKHLSCELLVEEKYPGCHTLVFKAQSTLHELVCNVMISCLFLAGEDAFRICKVDENFVTKYVNIMNKLNVDYYLRYVFCRNFFKARNLFDKFAPMLETDDIQLAHGDTAMQRLRFVEAAMDGDYEILDIGCGEGLFALNIPKRNASTYHAVDIDEDLVDVLGKKARARKYDVQTYTDVTQFEQDGPVDVLLVEVIEHMPKEEAEKLIDYVLDFVEYNKIFITTPNRAFNKNYLIDGFRHDDHDWEMDSLEFPFWMGEVLGSRGGEFSVEFVGIGDCVEGEYTTQGVIITNANRPKRAVLTVGASGSGKSTYARHLVHHDWVEINRDNIRFKGGKRDWREYNYTKDNEYRVSVKADKQLDRAIAEGKDIIISDTNLREEHRVSKIAKLEAAGYHVSIKEFDVDFNELLERNYNRQGGIPYEALLSQYIQFQRYKGVEAYKGTPGKPDAIIFDIDGTLADKGNRSPFDLTKVSEDTPIRYVTPLVEAYASQGFQLIFLSGRHDICREDTVDWLESHASADLGCDFLFMREEGDNRKDYIIKMELFDKFVRDNYNVIAVVDDRKQVIEQCWNVLGIPVISVGNNLERF